MVKRQPVLPTQHPPATTACACAVTIHQGWLSPSRNLSAFLWPQLSTQHCLLPQVRLSLVQQGKGMVLDSLGRMHHSTTHHP